jgi:replicative DNA helicase
MLSDLRESGSIEQDADMVLFLYRPEYYGLEVDEEGKPTTGRLDTIVAKHRAGALKTVHSTVEFSKMRISAWDSLNTLPIDLPLRRPSGGLNDFLL